MPTPRNRPIPPDPDGQNKDRSDWAEIALEKFMYVTRCDRYDAVADLLCDLRHWCDRNGMSFMEEFGRAMGHYKEETTEEEEEDTPPPTTPPDRPIDDVPF